MLSKSIIVLPILLLITFSSCFNRRWSEKKRQKFKAECDQTQTVNSMIVLFKGFANTEFDSVLVREYKDSTFLGSFKIFVEPAQSPYDIEHKKRMATIYRPLNIHCNYRFIVPGQKPYELSNMKMIMWPQFSMLSEGWGCVMGDYTINGERFEQNANPAFIKSTVHYH